MPTDANGVYTYTEADTASPFSTLLNRLASSISTVIGQMNGRRRAGQVNATTNASGEIVVAFSSAISSASYSVAITDTNVGAGIGMIFWKVRAKTTAGFTARAMPSTGTAAVTGLATTFDYVATVNS